MRHNALRWGCLLRGIQSVSGKIAQPHSLAFRFLWLGARIAIEWEQRISLGLCGHVTTVTRSHGRQAMVEKESMAIMEPTTVEVSSDVGFVNSSDDKKDAIPLISSVSMVPVACDPISNPHYQGQDLQEETSYPNLEPKHKVFLSHSGVQKGFVVKLCKLLEAHNHYLFFDQRPDSLPRGNKFSALIIDAAKNYQVAVVVLSEDYLSSKWPMIELAEFVRTSKSGNKNLNFRSSTKPLFLILTISQSRISGGPSGWSLLESIHEWILRSVLKLFESFVV